MSKWRGFPHERLAFRLGLLQAIALGIAKSLIAANRPSEFSQSR
ncbi:MAG: hypothetical protein V7L29_11940 [Nostoc sp.]